MDFRSNVRSRFSLDTDLFSFVQSALNRLGARHNFLYNLLRGKTAKVFGGEFDWRGAMLTGMLLLPVSVIALPAVLLAGLSGRGGTITIHARKPSD